MSTNGSEGSPVCEPSCGRRPWLWAGGLLWGLVAIALVTAWQASRQQRLAVEQARAEALRNATLDPNSPAQIVLPVSQSSGDGQVINITDLLSQGGNADDLPMWSPDGIEDFSLTNCDGKTITKADLLGRPWAVCFVFTKCLGPCPRVTQQMKELQDRLKKSDVRLVTISVDPARDTPEVLMNYAKLNGADLERWYFLTGDQAAIYGLIHRSFRMPVQEVKGPNRQEGFEVIHSTNVMLVDQHGVVQGKFNAARDEEMVELRRELRSLAEPMPVADTTEPRSDPPVADAGSGR